MGTVVVFSVRYGQMRRRDEVGHSQQGCIYLVDYPTKCFGIVTRSTVHASIPSFLLDQWPRRAAGASHN